MLLCTRLRADLLLAFQVTEGQAQGAAGRGACKAREPLLPSRGQAVFRATVAPGCSTRLTSCLQARGPWAAEQSGGEQLPGPTPTWRHRCSPSYEGAGPIAS